MTLARYAAPDTVFETRVGGRGGEPVSHGVSSHLELSNKKKTCLVDNLRHDTKGQVFVLEE